MGHSGSCHKHHRYHRCQHQPDLDLVFQDSCLHRHRRHLRLSHLMGHLDMCHQHHKDHHRPYLCRHWLNYSQAEAQNRLYPLHNRRNRLHQCPGKYLDLTGDCHLHLAHHHCHRQSHRYHKVHHCLCLYRHLTDHKFLVSNHHSSPHQHPGNDSDQVCSYR